MTNILVDHLPEALLVDGKEYKINFDFRSALYIILAFEDIELTPVEKQIIFFSNIFEDDLPENISEALKQAKWFLDGGKAESENAQSSPRVYSFSKDANLIYAAFKQTHNIDLNAVELHWWKFLALFMDLGADTTFCQLRSLRYRVFTGKATKEEVKLSRSMGDIFKVPKIDNRSLDQKIALSDFDMKDKARQERLRLEAEAQKEKEADAI